MKPLGPNEIGIVDTSLVDRIIENINHKLSDPRWVKDWRCGGLENPHYRFVQNGTANDRDKEELVRLFRNSGWGAVKVLNSEENGERPGLVEVTLYTRAPAAPPIRIEQG